MMPYLSREIHLAECPSTNTYVRQLLDAGEELADLTLVYTDSQTAGRGQASNRWESAAGRNVAFSLLCRPESVPPARQFAISETIALAVVLGVTSCVRAGGAALPAPLEVKWPNDIYCGGRKLCGTLIECDLRGGRIARCIIGTGINVNQTEFLSDAPNPVSLKQLCGRDFSPETVLRSVCEAFCSLYGPLCGGGAEAIHAAYLSCLYRREGWHRYADRTGEFDARIEGVEPTGRLCLSLADGSRRDYEYKEVKFVL